MILALRHNVTVEDQTLANQNPVLTSGSRDIDSSTANLSLEQERYIAGHA